jgi:hypothetical protein
MVYLEIRENVCQRLYFNITKLIKYVFFNIHIISNMGNTKGGGSGSWRNERVVSASYHTRSLATSSSGPGSHHGVVVNTDKGNSYLIHHPGPGSVTTVTSASNMSSNWSKSHNISVQGNKTVQEVYNGAGGRSNNTYVNYATGGTCIGVAKSA